MVYLNITEQVSNYVYLNLNRAMTIKDVKLVIRILTLWLVVNILAISCIDNTAEPLDIVDVGDCVVIVPDIQYYTNNENRFKYLDAIVDYCNDKQKGISFILQTGDVTNNNQSTQWINAYQRFFSQLPNYVPLIFCLGNHDYGDNGSSNIRHSNMPNELTPFRDETMVGSLWDNYLRYVYLGGKKVVVISLEFAPRNEVLDWADNVIKENHDNPVIILTHAFLNNSGALYDATDNKCDNQCSQKYYKMGSDYINDSKEIFDKIVYNNSNVKMIICGHSLSNNYIECLETKNIYNENVYSIMVNYQHYTSGGAGYIGLLYYNEGVFNLRSFNTVKKTYGNVDITFKLAL